MATARRAILIAAVLLSPVAFRGLADSPPASIHDGIQQALAALRGGNAFAAERVALAAAEANQAGSWRAWMIVAAARERLGQYEKAEDAYRQFISMCSSADERAFAMGRVRRCQQAANPAPKPQPVSRSLSAEQRRRLAVLGDRTITESTEHFVVRARNAELAKLVGRQAEISLSRICRVLLSGQVFPHSVDVYVWPDLAEFRKHAKGSAEWAGGAFSLQHADDGRVVRRIDLTQLDESRRFDPGTLDRVLPHEMCHLVLAEYFGDAHCPLALNEGLAMMAEATVHNGRVRLAGAALAGTSRIGLARLLRMDAHDVEDSDVFYAEAFSFTAYLHARLTGPQFREMLGHIQAGLPLDEALQRTLCLPPREDFLGRLAAAWEAEAVRQSQFLRALEAKVADATR